MKITGDSECIIIYPEKKSTGSEMLKQVQETLKNQLSKSFKYSESGSHEMVVNVTFSLEEDICLICP